jgi:hypothetical protein
LLLWFGEELLDSGVVGLDRLGYDAESQRKNSFLVRSRKSAFGIFIKFDGRQLRSSGLIKK